MKQDRPIVLALRGVSKRFDRLAVDTLDLTATTALAASRFWAALSTAAIAFGVLAAVWLISPSRA
jgi:hypothetical protein